METDRTAETRIRVRDAGARMLKRATAVVAFGAVAGVGLLGAVSAYTIPGIASYSSGATASTDTSSSSTSTSASSGLQSSSSGVGSSSSSGVAVSGGS